LATNGTSIFGHLTQFKSLLRQGVLAKAPVDELPLRAELFSTEQMVRHGKALASAHRLTPARTRDPLLPRLAANEGVLVDVCRRLTAAVSANHRISPAGEWLVDNFHLIEEQIAMAKRHLPEGYSRQLPRLASGPSAGLPRVYDIALETISHGDARLDVEGLGRFVAAYQSVTTLTMGELWAIPIMLRLALIENLRRVGVRIAVGRVERDLANTWADRMMDTAEHDPKSVILVIADMARSTPPMTSAFVAELARRLQGQTKALALALTWIEQRLAESHSTIAQLVQLENQQQAADQVSISNSIGSLRVLSAIDWREFVESSSLVHRILRRDPQAIYSTMEFVTRDRYRHAAERIAKESGCAEADVAAAALRLAQAGAASAGIRDPRAHVGFFLIDDGVPELEQAAGVRSSVFRTLRRTGRRFPLLCYLGAIATITALISAALVANAQAAGADALTVALVLVLSVVAASEPAVALVNWIAARLVRPQPLPRMDFSAGIPPDARTLVVVPTMLTDVAAIDDLVDALEIRFLANRDDHVSFGLLTDFPDAPAETLPTDAALLNHARARIEALNEKHAGRVAVAPGDAAATRESTPQPASPFYLFHRPRRRNPVERVWMGRERKRGKLSDLNALLGGGDASGFALVVGATAVLPRVRYVITLDTDTQLPRDAARQFAGAMAHPLNVARFDESGGDGGRGVVTRGHGILQPRVSVSLPAANRSRYARLLSGNPGIDQYTRTVSNVYQDVFGEGSFVGKGIYDVAAFERALAGRFAPNRILSHDLLEGCYARAGLLSDAELFEACPARYAADVARRRRWIRGDWQLSGWLRRHVRRQDGQREPNPLSLLSQWKILDNLRRSLVAPALAALLLVGWALTATPLYWSAVVAAVLLFPHLLALVSDAAAMPDDVSLRQHLVATAGTLRRHVAQAALALAFLPYEAYYCLDAILRTVTRMLITRRRLLEWNPSSAVERALEQRDRTGLLAAYRDMAVAPIATVAIGAGLAHYAPAALLVAAPILLLWAVSPALAWWVSRPLQRRNVPLSADQTRFLRKLARQTWAYFEQFVGPDDHWLPPDNVQETPTPRVAHRTSPTNMGLALLANVAAHDFGYVSTGKVLARTGSALDAMSALDRHRGHFYNWYDTLTGLPLPPAYISTVDSGNLAGHLLTLRPALAALADAPILNASWIEGLEDTLRILADALDGAPPAALAGFDSALEAAAAERPAALAPAWRHVAALATSAAAAADSVAALPRASGADDAVFWANALAAQCADLRDDLTLLAPWLLGTAASHGAAAMPWGDRIPTLRDVAAAASTDTEGQGATTIALDAAASADPVQPGGLATAAAAARRRLDALERMAAQALEFSALDYRFLFDGVRRQFVIGYNVTERRRDASYYDLLASEARLSNFVAIAQGALPQESWFALGRLLTAVDGEPVLLAWSGSMFEYLMPLLVMPTYENTLLDQTYRAAVLRQIDHGRRRGVPWGMSESGYNTVDVHQNYQYRAFGVPGLGLKRGLADDLVVAPYASALALMVFPEVACFNLQRLAAAGLAGRMGLYEAIDYTPSRLRRGESAAIVRSFMAHHQGMSLLAYAYALLGRPMQRRFESEPRFAATLLLLQERIPRTVAYHATVTGLPELLPSGETRESPIRVLATPHTPFPEVQLLSNGRYHVMVTNAGGGSSRWNDLAVTRWREDTTCDSWGMFCYIREEASGEFWSTAHQPTARRADHYEAIFSEGRAEFRRSDLDFETHTEIVVSPEDDVEVRRVHITNRGRTARALDVTSYAEVVLAPAAADVLHPAFSNLFVQTEIVADRQAIICTRRARSREEHVPWMFHLMTVRGPRDSRLSFETDRMRFVGRGGSPAVPRALTEAGPLSGTAGSVLDPIAAIRRRMVIEAGATAIVDIVTGAGETREAVVQMVDKYQDRSRADRVFELAWTHSHVVLRQLNATEADAQLYARLASSVIYANASLRVAPVAPVKGRRGQSGLWGYGISGDLPIVLLQIADATNIELVRQMVQAHAYWSLKGLAVDLVIWNEDHDVYRQRLQEQIIGLIAAGVEAHVVDRPGGIFVRHAEQISPEDRALFHSVARVIIVDGAGTLTEQVNRRMPPDARVPPFAATRPHRRAESVAAVAATRDLLLPNGLGGFSPDGREYVIAPDAGAYTPAPWANVIANPGFGTVLSESGLGYTWSDNAHLFRLTPWNNDPVSDGCGEALYLRDEETGHFWSPTPAPCGGTAPYVTRHGFGYSVFAHEEDGLRTELTVFVAIDAAVKCWVLKVWNRSERPRRLSATGYAEWVLGDVRAKSAMHVLTEIDGESGALFARNPYNSEFAGWVGFFDVDDAARSATGDRSEFIGRNRSLADPAALHRTRLSGRVGAALDPCAALQVAIDLAAGGEREIVFRLGAAASSDAARVLTRRYRGAAGARDALEAVVDYWRHTLGAVQVETPDPALNVMANGWLVYQTLACRLWARSGYYQSGGAYGFRDQLQDTMALIHAEPARTREQIVRCAERQFVDGDVQHWWHPPSGRGVRTHCSDDFLWLPLAVARYVLATGDTTVLDERAAFLEGRPVGADEDSYYDLPQRSAESATVYAHCVAALLHGLRFGDHGLPLIGSGDWNDGMNLVGRHGKGESVWLAFFLCHVLGEFARIARLRDDSAFAERCDVEAAQLRRRVDLAAWDGGWYRRAYFDDGAPLGSAQNSECQIDSVAQSWAVLSRAGDPVRARVAMDAVHARLVRPDAGLIQLLDPPFDTSDLDPGYIRGYVPGVRENGGQYTHGAIWVGMAFAALGDTARAWEVATMINPVNHARTPDGVAIYKVEPYVVAADVYALAPHTGRGGWTWYTGSAGWMYRLVLESLLGLHLDLERLCFAPCMPADWNEFTLRYRYRETHYRIIVRRVDATHGLPGAIAVTLDGVTQEGAFVALADDRILHVVEVRVAGGLAVPAPVLAAVAPTR